MTLVAFLRLLSSHVTVTLLASLLASVLDIALCDFVTVGTLSGMTYVVATAHSDGHHEHDAIHVGCSSPDVSDRVASGQRSVARHLSVV